QVRVADEHLARRVTQRPGQLADEPLPVPAARGPLERLLPGEALDALQGERHLRQLPPQVLRDLAHEVDVHQPVADHPTRAHVIREGAVAAQGDAVAANHVGQLVHPAWRAGGDQDDRGAGLLHGGEHLPGALGDGAVRAQQRAVAVRGDDAGSPHSPTTSVIRNRTRRSTMSASTSSARTRSPRSASPSAGALTAGPGTCSSRLSFPDSATTTASNTSPTRCWSSAASTASVQARSTARARRSDSCMRPGSCGSASRTQSGTSPPSVSASQTTSANRSTSL